MLKKKGLRSGYTTGACAAAAAKAATILAVNNRQSAVGSVEIPFPDGTRVAFKIHSSGFNADDGSASASVIKDAGDDPDVTNGAEISATVRQCENSTGLIIKGGKGVGIATKPGLPVAVGEPAINPVPRKMIQESVMEAVSNSRISNLEITISVAGGETLAKKTLNSRLGIIGGISILGTTGIVRPISSEAWTATISSSMDVAKAMGRDEVVISAGRSSEKAHMSKLNFPEESYVMMGDYLEFALLEAKKHGFKKIHLCAQWAKMLKIAMATPQTHVRHGALDTKKAVEFLNAIGIEISREHEFNTAREIFDIINTTPRLSNSLTPLLIFTKVCNSAKKYAEDITGGIPVVSYLVSYEGEIIVSSE